MVRRCSLSPAIAIDQLPLGALDALEQRADGLEVGQALALQIGGAAEVVVGGLDLAQRQARQAQEVHDAGVLAVVVPSPFELLLSLGVLASEIQPQALGEQFLGSLGIMLCVDTARPGGASVQP